MVETGSWGIGITGGIDETGTIVEIGGHAKETWGWGYAAPYHELGYGGGQ